jgi:hypothetical protein
VILLGAIATMQAFAADKPAEKKGKSSNAAERAVQDTSKKGEKIADRATGATARGVKKAEKSVNNAGQKTGKWLKDKTN